MSEPLILPRNCGNCQHFDGEGWCALVLKEKLILGFIVDPALVSCTKHQDKDADDVEGAAV